MTKKYFILGLLLQCLATIAMDQTPGNKLNRSTDKLRCSQGVSRSEELDKSNKKIIRGILFYSGFCGNPKVDGWDKSEMKPLHYSYHSDCP